MLIDSLETSPMIEGILVRKTPFQDRHLIGDLILRNGKKQGVLFFGGLGGGKKVKPNNLEIGKLYNVSFKTPIKGDLIQTKEWQIKWSHEQIRYDYWKFLLLNFLCELSAQTAIPQEDVLNDKDSQYHGLFNVLSNGIFFLENQKIPPHDYHFCCYFIGKFMIDFGVMPQVNKCITCDLPLPKFAPSFLDIDKSGFQCSSDLCDGIKNGENQEHIRIALAQSANFNWKVFSVGMDQLKISSNQIKMLINYLIFHLNLEQDSLKTIKSLY